MPSRRVRSSVSIAAGVLAVGALEVGAALPAQAASGSRHVVRAGESIQQAVDRARPGDTIVVPSGVYRGSVLITVSNLTIRGAGRGTVIIPTAGAAPRKTVTSRAGGGSETSGADCSAPGNGICVLGTAGHRVTGVVIESLTVSGFAKNGVSGSETNRMTVRDVLVENNGEEGISQEKSTQGLLVANEAANNGEAGIFVTNIAYGEGGAIDTEGTLVVGNKLTGNRFGAVLRRARNLAVNANTITGNCSGVFVVGDENRPRGGDLAIRGNQVNSNDKYCPSDGRLPFLQGVGIVLTGVEKTVVAHNHVADNTGASPMSGGIVLFRSFNGGPDTGNTITGNVLVGNRPADLADRDGGTGNAVRGNVCRSAEPTGRGC